MKSQAKHKNYLELNHQKRQNMTESCHLIEKSNLFMWKQQPHTSILSKRDKDLSKLHEAIAIMFKLIASSLPEKIVYEISDLPILCIQFRGK